MLEVHKRSAKENKFDDNLILISRRSRIIKVANSNQSEVGYHHTIYRGASSMNCETQMLEPDAGVGSCTARIKRIISIPVE